MEKLKLIDQIHRSLPQNKTVESLAQWITEHQKEVKTHIDKVPFTPKEVADLEHKSSAASIAIDVLEEVKVRFMDRLNNGTDLDPVTAGTDDPKFLPCDVTIPPSKGMKALKANRQFAVDNLRKGYNEEPTDIYMIPFPEEATMVGVTIEGKEAPKYTRAMSTDEKAMYGNLFVKENDELRQLDNSEVNVSRNGTASIRTRSKGKNREAII